MGVLCVFFGGEWTFSDKIVVSPPPTSPVPLKVCDIDAKALVPPIMGCWAQGYLILDFSLHMGGESADGTAEQTA